MEAPKNNLTEKKPKVSLNPDDLIEEFLTSAYQEGLEKYFRESWRLGFDTSVMHSALKRHLTAYFYKGEDWDQETLENYGIRKHHLGAVIFCALCMLDTYKNHPEKDDRPCKLKHLQSYFNKEENEKKKTPWEIMVSEKQKEQE